MSHSVWPVVMRTEEQKKGFRIIRPGEVPWLPVDDWDPDCVVSQTGRVVRLLLVVAKEPGQGAFGRLVAGITAAGLQPTVLAPGGRFRAHLERTGWTFTVEGDGFLREECWRP